jgi:hypothetical protein
MTIKLGGGHCCVCQGVCHHVGGPWYCEQHERIATAMHWPNAPQPVNVGMHPCQIEFEKDPHAHGEQYLIRCRCHATSWQIWQPGDPAYVCPVTGVRVEQIMTHRAGITSEK